MSYTGTVEYDGFKIEHYIRFSYYYRPARPQAFDPGESDFEILSGYLNLLIDGKICAICNWSKVDGLSKLLEWVYDFDFDVRDDVEIDIIERLGNGYYDE